MKTWVQIFTIGVLFTSCNWSSPTFEQRLQEIRTNNSKQFDSINAIEINWARLVDSLVILGDSNSTVALNIINKMMSTNTSLDANEVAELSFIKGNIFYHIDSFELAINEFTHQINNSASPGNLAARAGVYIKLKQFDKAFIDLKNAVNINYDFLWNLGNYYEIIGNIDSAGTCYRNLYLKDTIFYKYCNDRLIQLNNSKTKPYKELVYRDRGKRKIVTISIR